MRDHGKFNKYRSVSRGGNDESKGAWYIVSLFNIFLFLSGEEAGTLVFCRKFHVEMRASAGNKTY